MEGEDAQHEGLFSISLCTERKAFGFLFTKDL